MRPNRRLSTLTGKLTAGNSPQSQPFLHTSYGRARGSNEEYEMLGIAGSTYWPASLATYLWHSIVTRQFPSGAHTPQSFHV